MIFVKIFFQKTIGCTCRELSFKFNYQFFQLFLDEGIILIQCVEAIDCRQIFFIPEIKNCINSNENFDEDLKSFDASDAS